MNIYETTPFRAIPALFAGAVVGTVIVVFALALSGAVVDGTAASLLPDRMFNTSFILAPFVFIVFAAGAVFIAGPCWWVLHRMGRRTRWDAMLLGALLCAAAGFVPPIAAISHLTLGHLTEFALVFVVMAVAGALAGLAVWRLAYRALPDDGLTPNEERAG
jgi:hypothetical protein